MAKNNTSEKIVEDCMPAVGTTYYPDNDPRKVILSLVNSGKAEVVIDLFDHAGEGIPNDSRLLNGLTWAHTMVGNKKRSCELGEAAICYHRSTGERPHLAAALVNWGAIAWRQGGSPAARPFLFEALTAQPSCEIAWMNLMNYASRDHDSQAVETVVKTFVAANPDWDTNPIYRHWLQIGVDLTFARTLACFAPLLQKLA